MVNWLYNWSPGGVGGNGPKSRYSTLSKDLEFVPQIRREHGFENLHIHNIRDVFNKTNHFLVFNEPSHDSPTIQDEVTTFKNNALKTGLRIVSPSAKEDDIWGNSGWLDSFMKETKEQGVRIDVIAVHWYDWDPLGPFDFKPNGQIASDSWWGREDNSEYIDKMNDSVDEIFNRFKTDMIEVYERYDLPIWITEFNANKNRPTSMQELFMEKAMTWMESVSWIERYCWYQPDSIYSDSGMDRESGFGEFHEDGKDGNITSLGKLYRDHKSVLAIKDERLTASNSLEKVE